MKKLTVILIILGLVLTSAAQAADYLDKDKKNREYAEPTDETAVVFVVRNSSVGMVIKFWAFADDEFIGLTRGKGYFFAEVPPGKHLFWSKAENVSALELEVEAGKTYFLKQGVGMGLGKARVKLVELDEAKGRKLIQKLPYAQPTDEGRVRAQEIIDSRYQRVLDKRARKNAANGGGADAS